MANDSTLLTTNRPIAVSNNPKQNVEQVNNNVSYIPNVPEPINSNANGTQGLPRSGNDQMVSPITIPIQIQPQIATNPQTQPRI